MCSDMAVPTLIVLYNFETHEFGEISGPAHLVKNDALAYTDLVMVVIGNRLSIIDRFTCWLKFSVWVMKEYGVKDSWSREFVVDTTGWLVHARQCLMPIICRNNGEIVMVSDHGFILLYDMNKKKGRVVNHPPLELEWRVLMHTPSFISLTDVVNGTELEVVKVAPRLADPGLIPNNYLELSATFSDEAETASSTVGC
ncbi:uncharacterized protein LOC143546026 isoform X1 [Bidens hawaiensis]|uniref:uncharacterized protein LOC143546026 isoform X1 n=1 Tax=Bidens hawaiensis TaxID=980011 RepID=UPI004049DB63